MKFSYIRYIRHVILPDIGILGQDVLSKSKVLCIGAGGLGSTALMYLAAGVGSIGIMDFDKVNLSNLNRQIIFSLNDIGKNKAYCAKEYLLLFNNLIDIQAYDCKLSYSNSFNFIKNYDIVLDCTDNLESKFLINDIFVSNNIPVVHGSVFGLEGYFSLFSKGKICYRCLYKNFDMLDCVSHGIIGPVAGIVGAFQALVAIILLLRDKQLLFSCDLFSKLFFFDFKSFIFKFFNLKRSKSCHICF